jgi:lactoylglutathione lyase
LITHVTLATIPVRDQDAALDFFVNKLGFEKRTDAPYGAGRWIEVAPPGGQTSVVLDKVDDPNAVEQSLLPVLFGCEDAAETAAKLRVAGVEVSDPDAQAWGTYILVNDPWGRQICITQNDSVNRTV